MFTQTVSKALQYAIQARAMAKAEGRLSTACQFGHMVHALRKAGQVKTYAAHVRNLEHAMAALTLAKRNLSEGF